MFHLLLRWCISVASSFSRGYSDGTGFHPYPRLSPHLGQDAASVALRFIRSHHFVPETNREQIRSKIKLNWRGLAGSDSMECYAYKREKDQLSICQLCLGTYINPVLPMSYL